MQVLFKLIKKFTTLNKKKNYLQQSKLHTEYSLVGYVEGMVRICWIYMHLKQKTEALASKFEILLD